jgi:ribosome-associated toxin RatA of RatAB toxin-antitoxin module
MKTRTLLAAFVASLSTFSCAGTGLVPDHLSAPARGASVSGTTLHRTVAELPATLSPFAPATSDVQPGEPKSAAGPTPVAVPVPGSSLVRGRSTVTVKAPIDRVRQSVLGFADYADFMPHYSKCKVLGRAPGGGRDVYMEVEALHGAVKMWARVEVPRKPAVVDGVETYETQFLDGNVQEFKAIWRLRPVDDGSTELSLEVFLEPKLPLPSDLINRENLNGSAAGVLAMRARAEQATK